MNEEGVSFINEKRNIVISMTFMVCKSYNSQHCKKKKHAVWGVNFIVRYDIMFVYVFWHSATPNSNCKN